MATTLDLLDQLELGAIPRILVLNKTDLIDRGDARRLVLGRSDVVAVIATDRESTRPLLAMIAERLKERWDDAALTPHYASELDEPLLEDNISETADPEALTTLAEMLGHRKRARVTAQV